MKCNHPRHKVKAAASWARVSERRNQFRASPHAEKGPDISFLSSAPCRVDDDAACTLETTPALKQKLGISTRRWGCLLDLLLLPTARNTFRKRMCRFQRNWANFFSLISTWRSRDHAHPCRFYPSASPRRKLRRVLDVGRLNSFMK